MRQCGPIFPEGRGFVIGAEIEQSQVGDAGGQVERFVGCCTFAMYGAEGQQQMERDEAYADR